MKKCTKCDADKSKSDFQKCSETKDGFQRWCQPCMNEASMNRSRTRAGVVCSIYRRQKRSSKQRGHEMPTYSKSELFDWVIYQSEFESLYSDWKGSGFLKGKKPSVDRLDDYKGYSFDNIRLTTWEDNNNRSHRDMINGVNNKLSKSIKQLTLDGNVVNQYYSLMNAHRETGVDFRNISRAALSNGVSGGYKWAYV